MTAARRTRELLGVPIAALTLEEAAALAGRAIAAREPLQIGVVNAAKLINMRRDERLRQDVLSCDVVFADGMSVVWAGRVLGHPLPGRVAGIDLMHALLRNADREGHRVFCLGATEDVLARTVAAFTRDYPGAHFVGAHHGYFTDEQEEGVAAVIRDSRADLLLVAMTSPRKERFMARWGERLGITVCHGVGGSFDVVAGKVRRAPESWQRLGLEWLYRVKQEPRRLASRYLVTNTLFVGLVAREYVRRLRGTGVEMSGQAP